jgi:hypothetical protein
MWGTLTPADHIKYSYLMTNQKPLCQIICIAFHPISASVLLPTTKPFNIFSSIYCILGMFLVTFSAAEIIFIHANVTCFLFLVVQVISHCKKRPLCSTRFYCAVVIRVPMWKCEYVYLSAVCECECVCVCVWEREREREREREEERERDRACYSTTIKWSLSKHCSLHWKAKSIWCDFTCYRNIISFDLLQWPWEPKWGKE